MTSGARALVVLLAGYLTTFVAAGCTSTSSTGFDGRAPLVGNDTQAQWCLPRLTYPGEFSHGSEDVFNSSDKPVRVTDVTLDAAVGLELVQAFMAPSRKRSVGTLIGWPPEDLRVELEPLETIPAGTSINLVLRVRSTRSSGDVSFDGVTIEYEQDDRHHLQLKSRVGVTWATRC